MAKDNITPEEKLLKIIENPDLVVVLQADKEVPYGYVTDVLEALKLARALKVTFATNYEMGGGG